MLASWDDACYEYQLQIETDGVIDASREGDIAVARQIEFFYDYLSPFSYLADTQLPALVRRTGAEIVYRPILLGAIMKATGNSGPLPIQGKAGYNVADFQRWAKRYGVPAQFSPIFRLNTIPCRAAPA